ncbi:hypothetical protein RRG08_020415 [Elysia crispata]|uniref:Uncharacterized protein n=1 Tax=Elysia crispata TaxID=231223 RepID=A0AAE1EAM6_9GAST|nr:hypothetical protein RRG08_020415 [Elysia crispata]
MSYLLHPSHHTRLSIHLAMRYLLHPITTHPSVNPSSHELPPPTITPHPSVNPSSYELPPPTITPHPSVNPTRPSNCPDARITKSFHDTPHTEFRSKQNTFFSSSLWESHFIETTEP